MSDIPNISSEDKNGSLSPTKKKFSMSKHALTGATISAFLAAIWVVQYLESTYQAQVIEASAAEALLIVVSRFIIGFGLSWGPITAIIAAVRRD